MPIIVPIEENKVGLATATDAKFRAPDYSGSGFEALGAGLVQLGGSGQQLASGIEERRRRAAEAIAAAMLDDDHQRNIDDAAVKRAYVDYSDLTHEALHGDDGLFNRQGADAHAAFAGVVEKLVDNHDKTRSKLDDIQRAAVAPAMNERLRSDVERAADFVRQQGGTEQKWQSEQLQKAAARDAANHADDPDLFDHHIATGENAIRQQARIDNLSEKVRDKQLADYRSGAHADTIATLAQRAPFQAAGWYARYANSLNQSDKHRAEATLARISAVADNPAEPPADLAPVPANSIFTGGTGSSLDSDTTALGFAPLAPVQEEELTGPGDGRADSEPYANLRSLVRRIPGAGDLQDAGLQTGALASPARPDLARRWQTLPAEQRLQDPELRNAARAVNAAKVLLYNDDPDLLTFLGDKDQMIGSDVKGAIMRYIDEIIAPRAFVRGTVFNAYSDQDLRAGGAKAGLLYGALREANARALNHRQQQALAFFIGKHWSPEQASGIVASLTAESSLDAQRRQEKNRKGYGIAQWSLGEDRDMNFRKFTGAPLVGSSFTKQLEFVNYELTNGPRIFTDTGRKLKTATTAGEAAAIFASGYERMRSDAQPAARAKIADEIFQHFFPVKKR